MSRQFLNIENQKKGFCISFKGLERVKKTYKYLWCEYKIIVVGFQKVMLKLPQQSDIVIKNNLKVKLHVVFFILLTSVFWIFHHLFQRRWPESNFHQSWKWKYLITQEWLRGCEHKKLFSYLKRLIYLLFQFCSRLFKKKPRAILDFRDDLLIWENFFSRSSFFLIHHHRLITKPFRR